MVSGDPRRAVLGLPPTASVEEVRVCACGLSRNRTRVPASRCRLLSLPLGAQVKVAFRELALRLHPDVNPSSGAEFRAAHAAYKSIVDGHEARARRSLLHYACERARARAPTAC